MASTVHRKLTFYVCHDVNPDANDVIDFCSDAYRFAKLAGEGTTFTLGAAGAARTLGYSVKFERYRRAGGGVNLYKKNKRLGGVDRHPIPETGNKAAAHIDVPPKIKHWPYRR